MLKTELFNLGDVLLISLFAFVAIKAANAALDAAGLTAYRA